MTNCANVAATIHANMCNDAGFGYSMGNRWGGGATRVWTIDNKKYAVTAGDYDCSSSCITAWRKALEGTAYEGALKNATYTGNIQEVFVNSGLFEVKPLSFAAQRGDLYLSAGHHVAMCQTQTPDMLSEFSINEKGGAYGGQPGDQTGKEASIHGYYNYPWGCIIHYNGKADTVQPAPAPQKPLGYSTKLYQSNNTPAQQFKIEKIDNNYVALKNIGRNMYLDVKDGAKADHTPVRVWEGKKTLAQQWKLIEIKTDKAILYELEPKCAPGMRLDAIQGGTINKTGLQIHPKNGTAAQRWQFIDSGDGIYRIASSKSGLVIDAGAGVQL